MGKRTLWGAIYAAVLIAVLALVPLALLYCLYSPCSLNELATIQNGKSLSLLAFPWIILSLGPFRIWRTKEIVASTILTLFCCHSLY